MTCLMVYKGPWYLMSQGLYLNEGLLKRAMAIDALNMDKM